MKKAIDKPELKNKTSIQHIIIDAEYAGQRIDNFLITYLKNLPKTRVYRIIRKGEVRANKKRSALLLRGNDYVVR